MNKAPRFARLAGLPQAVARCFKGHPVAALVATAVLAASAWFLAILVAWFTFDVTRDLPGRQALRDIGEMAQSTTLYDIANRPVFSIFKEQRIEVPLAQVSPHLVDALISVEDQRFYDHRGVDLVRVVAAAVANLRSGRRSQGGSTITQQLARQSLLTRDKTFKRKLREVLLAARIEQSYSKQEILELYLNRVYFGDGFYGIEAASLGYFGKHASELSVPEAALLAGLIQSPSAYAPTVNKARAIARRNVVLAAMLDNHVIDTPTYERAKTAEVVLKNRLQREESFGLYFKELVRRALVDRFGWERVSEGGLRVYTTLDSTLQPKVEEIVETSLEKIEARRGYAHERRTAMGPFQEDVAPDYLQGGVVVMDVASGEVRALVGGRSFKESRFNRAVQAKRQAGSAFKPFVYAAALEQGLTPASLISNLDDPVLTADGAWVPEDEHSGADAMTMRTALRTSSNRAAVQALRTVGIQKAVGYVKQFEIGDMPAVPSLALGAGEVTLASMTAAFGAFADHGLVHKPVFIRRVEDQDGKVLFQASDQPHRAISDVSAFLMANMLSDVINAGTAWKARAEGFTLPAAGKTGTTNEYRDVWFVGFTPRLVTGVWLGFDQPKPIISNGYAGELAVPLWARIMKVATEGDQPKWLERPAGVVVVNVCRISGKLPADGCSSVEVLRDTGEVEVKDMIYSEYFARGTAPTEVCDLHPGPSFLGRITGALGIGGQHPVPEGDLALPQSASEHRAAETPAAAPSAAAHATAGADAAPASASAGDEAPKKKRGFWGRLFGGRDEKDKKKDTKPTPPPPRKDGGAPPPGP